MLSTIGAVAVGGFAGWYCWERGHRRTRPMPGGLCLDVTLPHEREWELYHNALSLCSKKVRVCLAELRIDYRGHHVDLIETGRYENIGRRFLAVNPAGLVPVLVHHGHPIYESHEQITYAAEHAAGGVPLIPAGQSEREAMQRWVHKASLLGDDPTGDLDTSAGNCIPGLTVPLFAAMIRDVPYRRIVEGLLFHRLKGRPLLFAVMKLAGLRRIVRVGRVQAVIERSRDRMHGHLDDLERQLAATGGPWILGGFYSLADVSWMVIFERLAEAEWTEEFLDPSRPAGAAYWQRLQARPVYRAGIAAFGHPAIERARARLRDEKRRIPGLAALYRAQDRREFRQS